MDKKLMVRLVIEKDEHSFSFCMPVGCPWGQVYDAAFEILNEVASMAKEAALKQEKVEIVGDKTQQ